MDSKPPKSITKPYKYSLMKRSNKEKEKRKKKRKIFIRNPSVKVQEPNIKDFLSFERIAGWWEAKLSKENKKRE